MKEQQTTSVTRDKQSNCHRIQSSLSKADTLGTKATVRFREVSALERVPLQRYKCNSAGSGPNLLSGLESVRLERADCITFPFKMLIIPHQITSLDYFPQCHCFSCLLLYTFFPLPLLFHGPFWHKALAKRSQLKPTPATFSTWLELVIIMARKYACEHISMEHAQ